MAVKYVTFDGKAVSYEWFLLLTAARKAGVSFTLNSGHRTIAEQWVLYRKFQRDGYPPTAYPNPNAPHIREGRWDHAVDIDNINGGADRVDRWAASKGVELANTVSGESWHKEIQGISAEAVRRKFTPELSKYDKWKAELSRIRIEVRRRGKNGDKNPWTGFRTRAKQLEEAIKRYKKAKPDDK